MDVEAEKAAAVAAALASKARADAEAGEKLEKILGHLTGQTAAMTALQGRLDAMEAESKARRDSEEKEKEDRKDAARKDAKARRDAERADWEKEDPETCKKDDDEEEEDRKKAKSDGCDDEDAADKARMARKDRMKARKDESEKEKEKEKDDAAKKDAARKDAEYAALKARADALEAENNRRVSERLAMLPKATTDADYAEMAEAQSRADVAYRSFGKSAPAPWGGETPIAFRRRLLTGMKEYSEGWKGVDFSTAGADVIPVAENTVYADAVKASRTSADVADGVLVPRKRTTDSGHQVTEYRGRSTIFKEFSPDPMYATAINQGKGF